MRRRVFPKNLVKLVIAVYYYTHMQVHTCVYLKFDNYSALFRTDMHRYIQ